MNRAILLAAALVATASSAAEERVGLYPPMPADGALVAGLHAAAGALPGVKPFDLLVRTECRWDDAQCLAGVAKRSSVDRILSAHVAGDYLEVRAVGADGRMGPAVKTDAPFDLRFAVRRALGKSVSVAPVAPVPEAALVIHPDLSLGEARRRTAHVLMGSGAALLAAASGIALYTSLQEANLDVRRQRGALTAPSDYDGVHAGQYVALALASTGVASIVAGTAVLAITPNGASLQTRW